MNKESLIALIKETKENIISFENTIFKERKSDYAIYRTETAIYLDTISFLEKITQYELNGEEIEAIKTSLEDIQKVLDDDLATLEVKSEEIAEVSTETLDEFKTINFDTITEEVNSTSDDYSSIDNFLDGGLPA